MAKIDEGPSWSSEQLSNARIIAQVGRQLGFSSRDIQIALMTAMQESSLRNLDYGDRDSIGLFQQRNAWGSRSARLNPAQSARMFFLGGAQGQRGLKDIKNRNSLELWQVAQKVQVSGFPRAYAQWDGAARAIMSGMGNLGEITPQEDTYKLNPFGGFESNPIADPGMGLNALTMSGADAMSQPAMPEPDIDSPLTSAMDKLLDDGIGGAEAGPVGGAATALGVAAADDTSPATWTGKDAQMPIPGMEDIAAFEDTFPSAKSGAGLTGPRSAVINMAKGFIGTPYKWGGAAPGAFDCSGLIQYVMNQFGMGMPRLGRNQAKMGKKVGLNQIQAGDLVHWPGQHIALYIGGGMILEAPRPGLSVRIRKLGNNWDKQNGAYGVALDY